MENCWEFMHCQREPGGDCAEQCDICPAAKSGYFDGVNRGVYGGRFCWAIVGTFCGGKVQRSFSEKFESCIQCDFFQLVQDQEGRSFQFVPPDKAQGQN